MGDVRICVAGFQKPVTHIPVRGYVVGDVADFDLVVISDTDESTALLAADTADWLQVSVTGGVSWDPVPTDIQAGFELGPLTAGVEREFTVRLEVPLATDVRHQGVRLSVGMGT